MVKKIVYDSYGNIISDTNPDFKVPFGFAGGLYDSDTKLVHFGYREYDPAIGRWISKDPLLFGGGDSNLYGYVLQDPVNLVDPTGEYWQVVLALLGGLLIYDTVSDWYDYLSKSYKNIQENKEIKTVEDYLKYRERVKNQLKNSCDIGKETTYDILKAGYPVSKTVDTVYGVIYEESK